MNSSWPSKRRRQGMGGKGSLWWSFFLVAFLGVTIVRLGANPLDVAPLELELDGPGENVDDPCFWVDPDDPAGTLIFVTTKDSGLVEVFNVVSGELVTTIPGFGRPNNCAVAGDLLLTTDRGDVDVKVHHIPDFTLVTTFGQNMREPEGIDVFDLPGGEQHVYVTDSTDASVHVYDLQSGELLHSFDTGFGDGIEPILADDLYQRIYIGRGEKESTRGIGLFDPDGQKVLEFAEDLFDKDAEGMAIYACGDGGYLVIADQRSDATQFEIFDRVTLEHLGTFRMDDGNGEFTNSTDGIDILQTPLPGLPNGIMAACDGCGSSTPDEMDVVSWDRIAAVMDLEVCPNGEAPDCVQVPCVERISATADAYVDSTAPDTNFGNAETLSIELDPPATREALFRFEVPDLDGFEVLEATLRLTTGDTNGSASEHGGTLYLASGAWSEDAVTFTNRPAPVGPAIGSVGAVDSSELVTFDVTGVITGGGTYDFIVQSASADKVSYLSREAGQTLPTLVLRLQLNEAPVVMITSPEDGAAIEPGVPVTFAASATDARAQDLSSVIVWTSHLDGVLGHGASVTVSDLSAGVHTITAEVVDTVGRRGTATVDVLINTPPAVVILEPQDGSRVLFGQPVSFAATADDAEDGEVSVAITWVSSLDGHLGFGPSVSVPSLSPGTHVITASVADTRGVSGGEQIGVVVVPPPTIAITTPENGSSVLEGAATTLTALAVDATDGDLSAAVEWSSDVDGPLGVGTSIVVTLSNGPHVLEAHVTNSSGLAATAQIALVVTPTPPVVTIEEPVDGSVIVAGDLFRLAGTATDTLDGDLGASIVWESNLQGTLGSGRAIIVGDLTLGTHIVTARATDADGLVDAASIEIEAVPRTIVVLADADTYVDTLLPDANFGGDTFVMADGTPERNAYWRFDVEGTAGVVIERAALRLVVSGGSGASSEAGGALYGIGDVTWAEDALTFSNRPPIDGPLLGEVGAVAKADVVEIDVTAWVLGDGPVAFAMTTASDDGVKYWSREAEAEDPELVLTLRSRDGLDPRPTVTILRPEEGAVIVADVPVSLEAVATDADDGDLSQSVVWSSDAGGFLGTGSPLTLPELSLGTHTIRADIVDSDGLSAFASTTVLLNSLPTVAIVSPAAGEALDGRSPVTFTGTALDVEDGDLGDALMWESDLQGFLGTGATIVVSNLVLGTHTITARVTDSGGTTATAGIVVDVIATTRAIAVEADAYVDASAPDVNFGTGPFVMADASPARQAFWRFLVEDIAGLTVEQATLRLTVSGASGADSRHGGTVHAMTDVMWQENGVTFASRPVIDGPALDHQGAVAKGTVVEFDVTAAVAADGPVSLALVTPASDGVKYKTREAEFGHPVLLVNLQVPSNGVPTLAITAPADGAALAAGAPVTLAAVATDAEDGDVSAAVTWASDVDGSLGVGATITVGLSAGLHELTASVVDSTGAAASAAVHVELIDAPPVVTILTPAAGTVIRRGEDLILLGTAEDLIDGDIGQRLEWFSSRDGFLGTGSSLLVSTLSLGDHEITAQAMDGHEGLGTASVRVAVEPLVLAFGAAADVFTVESAPTSRFGSDTHLIAKSAGPAIEIFMRFHVSGTDGVNIQSAKLRLTADTSSASRSPSGGEVYAVSDNGWEELSMSWDTQPAVDGALLDITGAVAPGDTIEFDVTSAIDGEGTYVFAVIAPVADAVVYRSREAGAGGPELVLSLDGE